MDPQEIIIDGKPFRLVKRSRRGEVFIYQSDDRFARVGERGVVEKMLALHKKFDTFGFPVPAVLSQGAIDTGAYYLEQSLGEKCFSFLFQDDIAKNGAISTELFEQYISITEKFVQAQLRSVTQDSRGLSLSDLIRPYDLAEELPEFGERIMKRYDEALSAIKVFPLVLTHGDFCSHNLFPAGVIDFEKAYYAPAGYDIVTNIFQNKYFPTSREYEYYQLYVVTPEQENLYYRRLDSLYREAGLPEVSKYRQHFEYCRAVWHTARNQRAPKIQQWRYEFFKKQYFGE